MSCRRGSAWLPRCVRLRRGSRRHCGQWRAAVPLATNITMRLPAVVDGFRSECRYGMASLLYRFGTCAGGDACHDDSTRHLGNSAIPLKPRLRQATLAVRAKAHNNCAAFRGRCNISRKRRASRCGVTQRDGMAFATMAESTHASWIAPHASADCNPFLDLEMPQRLVRRHANGGRSADAQDRRLAVYASAMAARRSAAAR